MKTLARLYLALIALLALFVSGCATPNLAKLVPEITARDIEYRRTGKFSNTTIVVHGLVDTPDAVTAESIEVTHNNPWMPNVEIVVRGYERRKAQP